VLFVCKCLLYYCHRVTTQLQLTNISCHISISTCFERLRVCAHYQKKQLCLCDTWYVLFCVDDCLVCILQTRQSSTLNNKYQVSHKHRCFSWWWTHSRPTHVEINRYAKNKYTKNVMCNKLDLFTRLYRDASQQIIKKRKMHVCVSVELAFYIIGNILLSVGVKSSQNGNDRRCIKTGAVRCTWHYSWRRPASTLFGLSAKLSSIAVKVDTKQDERWMTGRQLLGYRLLIGQIDPYVI
jgi:hypothetical protein